jgi:hypothetical protein
MVSRRARRYHDGVPFTPAHVLAVLPGIHARRALHLDPTCLVIGSMAPDFEYFARGALVGSLGHSLIGIAVWGVPVTLAVAVVFHQLVKWPVLLVGPSSLTGVFAPPWRAGRTLGGALSAIASAALGNLTHVVWDSATHSDGAIVRRVPALATPCQLPGLGEIVLHRILQHASTLIGLAGVTVYLLAQIRRAPRIAVAVPRAWPRIGFAICLAAGIAAALIRIQRLGITDPGNRIVAAISGSLAGTLVASLIVRRAAQRYQALVTTRPRDAANTANTAPGHSAR